jgi:two-component system chemotaxis response regulator CheB
MAFFCFGASTGGPMALKSIFQELPLNFPGLIGIVQHMSEPFVSAIARDLDKVSGVKVKIATDGDLFKPGVALMAPGNAHMTLKQIGDNFIVSLQPIEQESLSNYPSVDRLFCSAAKSFKEQTTGILLSGKGKDGVLWMKAIKSIGGKTIVQDARTSMAFDLPKAAIEANTADKIVPLTNIHTLMKTIV